MRISFDNRLMSSLLLYLDHEVLDGGAAYTNISGRLYPVSSPYSGLYAYATPFKQLVNDTSIAGASVMSGVYLNGAFVTIGTSGLYSINHNQGVAYFTGQLSSSVVVSGRYAVKDINVEITDKAETKTLFETKYIPRLRYNQTISGLDTDVKTLPALYLKYQETEAPPAAFGGIKDNKLKIKGLLLTENESQRISACNILKNLVHRIVPIVTGSTPFDYLGNFTGVNYNYNSLTINTDYSPIVLDVKVKDVPLMGEFSSIGTRIASVEFTISTFMR
jgi:hypothetical protein